MMERSAEKEVPTFKTNNERRAWLEHEINNQLTVIQGYLSIFHDKHPVLGPFFNASRNIGANKELQGKVRTARQFFEAQKSVVGLGNSNESIRREFSALNEKVRANTDLTAMSDFYGRLRQHSRYQPLLQLLQSNPSILIHLNIFKKGSTLQRLQKKIRKQPDVLTAKGRMDQRPDYLEAMSHFEVFFKERVNAQRIQEELLKIAHSIPKNIDDTSEGDRRLEEVQGKISAKADQLHECIMRIAQGLNPHNEQEGHSQFSEIMEETLNSCKNIHWTVGATKKLGHEWFNLPPVLAQMPANQFNPEKSVLKSKEVWVRGNQSELASVFTTILLNATRFQRAEEGRFQLVTMEEQPHEVHLHFFDRGQGFDPEVLERFHRGERVSTRDRENGGLGLDTARRVVHEHGGSIHITSEKGQFSNIHIILPKTTRPQ